MEATLMDHHLGTARRVRASHRSSQLWSSARGRRAPKMCSSRPAGFKHLAVLSVTSGIRLSRRRTGIMQPVCDRSGMMRVGPIDHEISAGARRSLQPPADVVVQAADQRRPAQRPRALARPFAQPPAQLRVARQLLERVGQSVGASLDVEALGRAPPGRSSGWRARPVRRGRGRPPAGRGPAPRARRCRWNRAGSGTAAHRAAGTAPGPCCARPTPASRPRG